jgi:NAD(P)-dependent dehydrogenase (short-subunit alcohol dehydrogenase family)
MKQTLFSLRGKCALVTGGSRGLGRAIAEAFVTAGANVAIAGRSHDSLMVAAADIEHKGGEGDLKVIPVRMDVTSVASIRAGVAQAYAALGKIDILVNNAGTEQKCSSLEVEEELWDRIMDTNLKGAFFACQAAARVMTEGAILNIGSLTSERGVETAVPYGSSKTALVGMTRALAVEWAPRGIRINALEPGYFRTALTESFYQDAVWQHAMLAKIPQGRFGEMSDLAGASVFLCSDAARYITGITLPVDGGTLAGL